MPSDHFMNLPSLQYIDINNSITSVISVGSYPTCSTLLRERANNRVQRCVVVDRGRDRSYRGPATETGDYRQPLLEAWPIFPDSLLSSEVAFRFPGLTAETRLPQEHERSEGLQSGMLDVAHHGNLHYRLQEPLPSYLGGHLYRAGSHAVVILNDEVVLDSMDTTLIHDVHVRLNPGLYRNCSPREVLVPHFLVGRNTTGASLKSRRHGQVLMEFYRLAHLCHRLNIIAKADIVLCDSPGIAVDAIRSSVPAAFVTAPPAGYEALQAELAAYLVHGNHQRLLQNQQRFVDDVVLQTATSHAVVHRQHTLQALLHRLLQASGMQPDRTIQPFAPRTHVEHGDVIAAKTSQAGNALILHTQQSLCSRANKAVRIKSGLESSRRKFQKFRESPTRFMEDSQNVILRSLVAGKNQR